VLIAHRGHSIHEDTIENIKEVAESMGWDVEKQICKNCKNLKP
jgi:hypothetical protein